MAAQQLDDTQKLINHLFDQLAAASTGGEVSQLTHALRIQITRKRAQGGRLSDRETQLVGAVGSIRSGGGGSLLRLFGTLIVLAALSAAAWYVYAHYLR